MPPAPTDKDRPRKRRRTLPRNFRTEQAAPQPRPRPKKGPVAPQGTGGGTSDRNPPIPSRPRPSAPKGAFEPFRRKHGIAREQEKARTKAADSDRKLPGNRYVPHVPVIAGGYSRPQKAAIRRLYRDAARRGGYKSVTELYQSASVEQRRNMRQVGRIVTLGANAHIDPTVRQWTQARNLRDTVAPAGHDPKVIDLGKKAAQAAGLLTFGSARQRATVTQLGKAGALTALNLGRATYEDPAAVAAASKQTAVESITGIPQGIKQLADDPVSAVESIVKDYEDRYGSVLEDPKAFRERVKSEWGLTPYVFDAVAAAGGSGQVLGAVARSTRFARAAEAMARGDVALAPRAAGRAGRALHRAATSERPDLRVSGAEEGGVRAQARSRNLFTAVGQQALDRRRRTWLERQRAQGGKQKALHAEVRSGEVTPITSGVIGRSLRELGPLRRYTGRVSRDIGGAQSVSRIRMLTTQGRVTGRMRKLLNGLSDAEKVAVREMAELGVRADADGIAALEKRLSQIDPDSPDAQAIRMILDDPNTHLTTRAREAVDELRDLQLEQAARDPRLADATEELRRLDRQATLLGVERGPNVERFRATLRKIEEKTGVSGLSRYADELAHAMPEDRPALAKKLAKRVKKQVRQAEADVETARRRLAVEEAEARKTPPVTSEEIRAARADLRRMEDERTRLKGELEGRKGEHVKVKGVRDGGDFRIDALRDGISRLDIQIAAAKSRLRLAQTPTPETAWFNPRPSAKNPPVGRGFIDGDGVLHTWNEGEGTHDQVANARGVTVAGRLNIRADGTVVGAGGKMAEAEAVARATAQDGRLKPYGGLGGEGGHLSDAELARIRGEYAPAGAAGPDPAALRAVERRTLELAARRETRDMLREFQKGMDKVVKKTKAQSKKFDPRQLEDHEAFAARIRAAADEAGLAEPAYWKGLLEGALDEDPGVRLKAVGRGTRATERPKRDKGVLKASGRGERDPEVLVRGVETNIKRRFQYQLVVRNIETHAFDWSRGPGDTGMTIEQIKWYLREHDIDPKSVEMLDTRIVTRREGGPDLAEDPVASGAEDWADHRLRGKDLTRRDYKDLAQNRYLVFPREVGEALDGAAVKLDSTFTRALEVLIKQKPARLMLGALNVPWLAFQVASNTLLTGLGGGLNPFDIYGAHKWWKGLDVEAREAIEAELGITYGHHFNMDQPNLGATNSRMVATWRGFKATKAMRVGHRMNPLDAMFKVDEAQNNFFRRTLFYSKARKAAYRRMGYNWRGIARNMDVLMDRVMGRPPDRMAQTIARHGAEFEAVAKHTADFLGDYLRFSPSERFLLSRNVMFYGYLRFSLRFAFYTMPVGHPIMTNIIGNIGRMGANEIKDIFGVPRSYDMPASMLAQMYVGDRRDAKAGTLRSINFGRMNPFLNAVTQMEDFNQAAGLVSPMYGMLVFTGRDWRVRGEYTPSETERTRDYYGSPWGVFKPGTVRNRIATRQAAKLFFPYRVAEDMMLKPSQSDDALAWSPRPLYPKEEEAKAGVAKSRRVWREEGALRRAGAGLLPVLPTVTAAPQVVKREQEKRKAEARRRSGKPKRRRRRSGGGMYGGGGGLYGG